MRIYLNQDVYTGLSLIVISAIFLVMSYDLIAEARLFPLIFLIIMIVFSILLIIKGVNRKEFNSHGDDEEKISIDLLKKPLVLFVGVFLYCLLINLIGFFLSSIIFMIAFMYLNKYKSYKSIIFSTLLTILFVYFIFVYQLNVAIPSGILFDN